MSTDTQTVTLARQESAKLGAAHVAVIEDESVVVAGEMRKLADGESHFFQRSRIEARRKGDQWTFTKVSRAAA